MKDYYYILGIEKTATILQIKSAYRKLSMKFHPDKNNGDKFFEERFKEIQEAYDTLSDTNKKYSYDYKLNNETQDSSQQSNEKSYDDKFIKRFTIFFIIAFLLLFILLQTKMH